jgi:hypothetical protein
LWFLEASKPSYRVKLAANKTEGGFLKLYNNNGREIVDLGVPISNKNGNRFLRLYNDTNQKVFDLGITTGKSNGHAYGHLKVYSNHGSNDGERMIVALDGNDAKGYGGLWLYKSGTGNANQFNVKLSVNDNGGFIQTYNADYKKAIDLGMAVNRPNKHKYGRIQIYSSDGSSLTQRRIAVLSGNDTYGDGGLWLYGSGNGDKTPKVRISSWNEAVVELRGKVKLSN